MSSSQAILQEINEYVLRATVDERTMDEEHAATFGLAEMLGMIINASKDSANKIKIRHMIVDSHFKGPWSDLCIFLDLFLCRRVAPPCHDCPIRIFKPEALAQGGLQVS